jgi:calcium-dependent protein kinase
MAQRFERFRTGDKPLKELLADPLQRRDTSEQVLAQLERVRGIVMHRVFTDRRLDEDYEMVADAVLGRGISGEVMQAVQKSDGAPAAIKTLGKDQVQSDQLQALIAEVEVGLYLDHPGICRVLAVYESPQEVSVVTEFCSGGDMFSRLCTIGPFPHALAQKTTIMMMEAVRYMHRHHVVHRDVKLENWLYVNVQTDSPICLTDFGFSTFYSDGVVMSKVQGTPYYMAPEVLRKHYTSKCDVWSVGVVTYMLLSGSPPFSGNTETNQLKAVLFDTLEFPEARWGGIIQDAPLAIDFCKAILTRDVDKRPTADMALKHPWLSAADNASPVATPILREGMLSLLEFAKAPELRRASLGVLAATSSQLMRAGEEGTRNDAEKVFHMMDLDNTGTITLPDFKTLLKEQLGINGDDAEAYFTKLDIKQNKEIHFSEFLAAYQQVALTRDDKSIRRAFEIFDVDKSGYISVGNLKSFFGEEYSGSRVEDIVGELLPQSSQGLSYPEFREMVKGNNPQSELGEIGLNIEEEKEQLSQKPGKSRIAV